MQQRLLSSVPIPRRPWRRAAAGVAGVVLLVVALASTISANQRAAADDLDVALSSRASAESAKLAEYFDRARNVALLLAHDSVFARLEPGRAVASEDRVASEGMVGAAPAAASALAYLEELYPGRISEACLIDARGVELARVVRGMIAPDSELSSEEAASAFFGPTMRLPRGRVHQAAPYLSPDTDEMVISNSTPMASASGAVWGMVHFEVALETFRPRARDGSMASIVDLRSGRVVLGRKDPAPGVQQPVTKAARRLLRSEGAVTEDGRRFVSVLVPVHQDNRNAWSVVASAPAPSGWSRSIGPAPIAMAFAALMLLAFTGLQLRARHRELHAASLTDALTELPNRRLFTARLDAALQAGGRRGSASGLLIIDLDHFKEVNDTLGHGLGDELLRAVAGRLRTVVRASDTVARLGGDEFAVLLPDIGDSSAALRLAERCSETLHASFDLTGVALHVEASIGVAVAPGHGSTSDALVRAADLAMYAAKARSAGVVVYDDDLDLHTPSRLELLGDLRRALQTGELVMHYQPKMTLAGDLAGVEALVRWEHPVRGTVPPSEFIPMAESTGLILPLTRETLDLAVIQARAWLDAGTPVQVAVNLSVRCLHDVSFPDQVGELLRRHGLPAHLLRLEITESGIMTDPDRALRVLIRLQDAGIALSIDDFGTGYSSMSYLTSLPVGELKIDRSFVTDLLVNPSDRVLVRSSIELAHDLGMSAVAEGVEDAETLAVLESLGCDVAQGYHLARPMSGPDMTRWMGAGYDAVGRRRTDPAGCSSLPSAVSTHTD